MVTEKALDNILNSKSKIAIIRLFVSKTPDFKVTGREVAKLTHFSAPAAHAALKELFNQGVLKLDNIGNQHIYSLDNNNRIVQKILKPMFKEEVSLRDELKDFLVKQINKTGIKKNILSVILYGSLQQGKTHDKSDVDIAVIIKNKKDKKEIEEKFLNEISVKFYEYFKAHLDTYIKTKDEFRARLKKNLSPISTLMKAYSVIYGKEPLEIQNMTAREIKIKREERSAATDYFKKATDNYEQMLAAIQTDNSNAASTLAIQCVISSADAICVFEKGLRSISQDHFDVCDLVASLPIEEAKEKTKLLRKIIAKKNLVQYERRNIYKEEALEIVKITTRFYQWVKTCLE